MKGQCKDCAKRETCSKDIGNMFGYCNTDFVPELNTVDVKKEVTATLDKVETEKLPAFKKQLVAGLLLRRIFGLISADIERLTLEAIDEYAR